MASADPPPTFLLLLPPPPSPPSIASLRLAYGETLCEVLKEVESASEGCAGAAVLEIALALPHLVGQQNQPRSALFHATQSILAAVYKLICVIAADEHINIEDQDGVDARILPIAWSQHSSHAACNTSPLTYGPVTDLSGLAASGRQWQYAFGVETDEGEAFVRAFVAAKQGVSHHHHEHDHNCDHDHDHDAATHKHERSQHVPANTAGSQPRKHSHVAVGGTFDHIHIGHKLLLTMTAFSLDQAPQGTTITVGITGDELLKNKKYLELLESWHDRQLSVHRFMESIIDYAAPDAEPPSIREINESGPNGNAVEVHYPQALTIRYVEIGDPFGPTITQEDISALIISAETRAGGKAVNDKRAERGWSALDVFEVDVLDPVENQGTASPTSTSDFQSKLSSTEIRRKLAEKTAAPKSSM